MGGKSEVELTTDVQEEVTTISFDVPKPYNGKQDEFVRSVSLRQAVKAGRRGGKTYGTAIKHVLAFLGRCWACLGEGCTLCDNTGRVRPKRSLYAAPTAEQVGKFWYEVTTALMPGIEAGVFKKDETEHVIEIPRTEIRIKAKTAWNASTMRGDWGDIVTLEEYQLWNEDAWQDVVQPMLLDTNGTAIFIFTPPSLKSEGISKAKDPRHASKLFNRALEDTTGRWATFHFTSYDNPYLSQDALNELTTSGDMSADSYRREILAEDDEIESSWLVYGKFDDNSQIIKRFTIPDNWDVYSGHDFGEANPAALFIAQVKLPLPPGAPDYLRYGDYVAFSEYAPGASSAEQHIDKFKGILDKRKLARAVGGNVTTEEQTRQLYQKLKWNIKAPEVTKVNLQIDRAISLIENRQIYVFEDLHQFLAQVHDCMWIVDIETKKPTNKIKDEARYHMLACFIEGTMITTDKGQVPIEKIKVGDNVLTRGGYHKVAASGETNKSTEVVTACFSDGTTLTGTPDHPIFVQGNGFVPLTSLRYGDIMEIWENKRSFIRARPITCIQMPHVGLIESILTDGARGFIGKFGKITMEKFLMGIVSIIKMAILSIMSYLTLVVFQKANICQTIWRNIIFLRNGMNTCLEYAPSLDRLGLNGLKPQKAKRILHRDYLKHLKKENSNVNSAGNLILQKNNQGLDSVPINANQHIVEVSAKTRKQENVPSVVESLDVINTFPQKSVQPPVKFLHVKPHCNARVYNFSVENVPEYYANGILVHNCLRYIATALAVKRVAGESEIAHAYVGGRRIW